IESPRAASPSSGALRTQSRKRQKNKKLFTMGYRSLRQCVLDLQRTKQLARIDVQIDPYLEAAEIQRRVYQAQGPALLFTRVKGCRFPMVSNLFGTLARTRFLFRDTLEAVRHLVELKVEPANFWMRPWRYRDVPRAL